MGLIGMPDFMFTRKKLINEYNCSSLQYLYTIDGNGRYRYDWNGNIAFGFVDS